MALGQLTSKGLGMHLMNPEALFEHVEEDMIVIGISDKAFE